MAITFKPALLYNESDGRYGIVCSERLDGLVYSKAPQGGFWLYSRNGQRRQFASEIAARKAAARLTAEQVSS